MNKRLKHFFVEVIPFVVLSICVLLLAYMIGGKFEEEATAIFIENIAMRTISFLLVNAIMMVSLIMLVFGHKTSNDNVIKGFLFKKLVDPLLSFFTVFCAPSYGMILGFTLLMLLFGHFDYALGSFITSIIVLCYVMLSELVRYIANNGFGEEVGLVKSRLASALFLLVTPALYWFIAEPVTKCVG